jgi:hypothetical protein
VGATIYFCSFLVVASNIIMALFMAVSAEYVSYDLVVSDTALVTVGHLQRFQVPGPWYYGCLNTVPEGSEVFQLVSMLRSTVFSRVPEAP